MLDRVHERHRTGAGGDDPAPGASGGLHDRRDLLAHAVEEDAVVDVLERRHPRRHPPELAVGDVADVTDRIGSGKIALQAP